MATAFASFFGFGGKRETEEEYKPLPGDVEAGASQSANGDSSASTSSSTPAAGQPLKLPNLNDSKAKGKFGKSKTMAELEAEAKWMNGSNVVTWNGEVVSLDVDESSPLHRESQPLWNWEEQ